MKKWIGVSLLLLSMLIIILPINADQFIALIQENSAVKSSNLFGLSFSTMSMSDPGDAASTSHGNFDQPDMFTGTASYTYDFILPPGTAGMEPKLKLV